jgi:6-phosphogluconate dehydrogenase
MNEQIRTLGLVGLGKMGFPIALNLRRNGFGVAAFDLAEENRRKAAAQGIPVAGSLEKLVDALPAKKLIWVMVPAGEATGEVVGKLKTLLPPGSIVIDGGNSNYKDSMRRYDELKEASIHLLDCGTSGGVSGALEGACTMIGGDPAVFEQCRHIFEALSVKDGSLYVGESGSGHFVKMVHNGIEYGMMQAIAEGFEVLNKSPFDVDYRAVAKVWNHGSVIRSWLIELVENAFSKDPGLTGIRGVMRSSGEGKWTVETALDFGVPVPVIALSLMMRYRSMEADTFAGKVVAALRNEFGGHAVDKV